MGKIIKSTIISLVAVLFITSCVTPRRVNYFQDMTQGSQIELENRFEARIAPYDELTITVGTSQSNQEMAAPFNSTGNSYLVDVNGNIEFPVLGKLHVAGLTRLRLQDTLTTRLARGGYLDDPFTMYWLLQESKMRRQRSRLPPTPPLRGECIEECL